MNTVEATLGPPEKALAKIEPGSRSQESFESIMALSSQLVTTGFLPVAVKTPAQAAAIILTGRELGLGPMQSLRSICIIQGKPELAADLQLSIFHRDGGRSKWLKLTDTEAEIWLRHPNGDDHKESFSMADAKRAGLTGQNWQKYPKAMLRSRAITAGLKSIGFEPLAGAYAPGEIGGPEIVDPIPPETGDDGDLGPQPKGQQNNSGVSGSRARPETTAGTSSPADARGVTKNTRVEAEPPKQNTARTEAASTDTVPFPTPQTRMAFLNKLQAAPGQPNEQSIKAFAVAAGVILETESLVDLPLQYVGKTPREVKLVTAGFEDWQERDAESGEMPAPAKWPIYQEEDPTLGAGSRGESRPAEGKSSSANRKPTEESKAVPENRKAAAPSQPVRPSYENKKDPEWWRDVPVHIPRKGMKLAEYVNNMDTIGSLYDDRHNDDGVSRRRLFGFVQNYEAKGWNGKPPTKDDLELREALDAFADWYEKNHPNEKL